MRRRPRHGEPEDDCSVEPGPRAADARGRALRGGESGPDHGRRACARRVLDTEHVFWHHTNRCSCTGSSVGYCSTLWSIAERTFAGDPREGVWEIRKRNALDSSTIVPGQVLVVPS
jgi:hypothetical protein